MRISEWNIEYIKSLLPTMERHLQDEFEDFDNFDEEGEPIINEDDMWDRQCEFLLESEEFSTLLCSEDYEFFSETLRKAFDKVHPTFFEDSEINLRAQLEEQRSYERDPLGYHGMKQSDFL